MSTPQEFCNYANSSDLIIFGDYNIRDFTHCPDEFLELIETIKKGKPIIYYGGWNSYGQGGYTESPFKEILPVKIKSKDLDYFSHNTKGVVFNKRSRFHRSLLNPEQFPLSTSYHKFQGIKRNGEILLSYRVRESENSIPLIVSSKGENPRILCLGLCIIGGGAKDYYVWDQFPYFLKLCIETVLDNEITYSNSPALSNTFHNFHKELLSKNTTQERLDLIKQNLEHVWHRENKIEQFTFLGDIAGFYRSEYAAVSRMLILPDLYFSNQLEYQYKLVDMYKYFARHSCINFDFIYASVLYKMAYHSQDKIQTIMKIQDPNTWSIYFQGISKICYSLALLGKEINGLDDIGANLEKGIELLDLYKNRSELENDVHDDKLLINDYAKALYIIIFQYGKFLEKRSRLLYFLPLFIKPNIFYKKFLSNLKIDQKIQALTVFGERYNEIPPLVDRDVLAFLVDSLKVIENLSKENLNSYLLTYEKIIKNPNYKSDDEWNVKLAININSIVIKNYESDVLYKKMKHLLSIVEWVMIFLLASIFLLKRIEIPYIKLFLESISDYLNIFSMFLFVVIFAVESIFKVTFKVFFRGKKP
ncbi:MAG: hypothetical protein HPY76_07480 [Anaerolineae bacterium]|nr:hypothetical protein [Anaerolineae bacterium]